MTETHGHQDKANPLDDTSDRSLSISLAPKRYKMRDRGRKKNEHPQDPFMIITFYE